MSLTLLVAALLKSSLLAGLGLGLARALAVRPVDRTDVLRATVCLLLMLPLWTAFGPALSLALLPAQLQTPVTGGALWSGAIQPVEGLILSGEVMTPSFEGALAWAWSLGALIVAGRFALGVWTLSRWTRQASIVKSDAWAAALTRLSPAMRPLLKTSVSIAGPLSWGLPPGTVLIDVATLARPDTASAVLAHELAHLRRRDWLFLALSRLALALFWFNPLVWWLHRELIERSEQAADAAAVARVDRHDYARALIDLATGPGSLAATAMAGDGSSLNRRIASIMTETPAARRRPALILAAVATMAAVATPIAALEIRSRIPQPPYAPLAPMVPFVPSADAHAAPEASSPSGLQLGAPPAPPAPPARADAWSEAPPAPPSLSLAPALAAPSAPPAPPAPPRSSRYVYLADGSRGWEWSGSSEDRVRAEEVRHKAQIARERAAEVRVRAGEYRMAARAQAVEAHAAAEDARARARVAVNDAQRAVTRARVTMRQGAEQMREGAETMRQEGRRLADPAYRAEQIADNAARGRTVTDAELRALGPRLIRQAAELEQRAVELDARANDS